MKKLIALLSLITAITTNAIDFSIVVVEQLKLKALQRQLNSLQVCDLRLSLLKLSVLAQYSHLD